MKKYYILAFIVLCIVGYFVWPTNKMIVKETADGIYYRDLSTKQLQAVFQEHKYNMADYFAEKKPPFPKLYVETIPYDFNEQEFDNDRPALFTEILMPLIKKANENVLAERQKIEVLNDLFKNETPFNDEQIDELKKACEKYDVFFDDEDYQSVFAHLLERIDMVPPALLLAMCAEDSGFATSKYARKYNNLFNLRDWDGHGIEPDEPREEGETYVIKTFDNIYDSIVDQIHYINTNKWFNGFHFSRANFRKNKVPMRGYSACREFLQAPYRTWKYPDILRFIITQYNWTDIEY